MVVVVLPVPDHGERDRPRGAFYLLYARKRSGSRNQKAAGGYYEQKARQADPSRLPPPSEPPARGPLGNTCLRGGRGYRQDAADRLDPVFDHESEYGSQWEAIHSIAAKIGCSGETLRKWVRTTEVDTGRRDGITSDERERISGRALRLSEKSRRLAKSRPK